MKKFILLFLLAVMSTATFATDPIKFGFTGGVNLSRISENYVQRVGYNVGVVSDIPIISNRVYITPSLQIARREYNLECSRFTFDENAMFTYIELPVQIKIKTNPIFNKDIKAFTSFGPSISYVTGLKTDTGLTQYSNVFQPGSYYDLKRFNWAIGVNFGIEYMKKYQASFGYNIGLTNISNSSKFENAKTRTFTLTLSYFL